MQFLERPDSRGTSLEQTNCLGRGEGVDADGLAIGRQRQNFGPVPFGRPAVQGGMVGPVRGDQYDTLFAVGDVAQDRRDFARDRNAPLDIVGKPSRTPQFFPDSRCRRMVDDHDDPSRARLLRAQNRAQQHREFAHARQNGIGRDSLGQNDGGVSVLLPIRDWPRPAFAPLPPRRSGQHHRTDRAHCRPKERADSADQRQRQSRGSSSYLPVSQRACFHLHKFRHFPG